FLGGVARRVLRLRPRAGDSRFQIKDSRLETGNSKLQTRNSKIEALRSSLVTRHLSLFLSHLSLLLSGVCLSWVFYASTALLLLNDSSVLSLFAGNPFPGDPPRQVRAVVWQYWFTDLATKRATGLWWRRELRGLYAPTLEREPAGKIVVVEWPEGGPQ